jgi:hypothetical protein
MRGDGKGGTPMGRALKYVITGTATRGNSGREIFMGRALIYGPMEIDR